MAENRHYVSTMNSESFPGICRMQQGKVNVSVANLHLKGRLSSWKD